MKRIIMQASRQKKGGAWARGPAGRERPTERTAPPAGRRSPVAALDRPRVKKLAADTTKPVCRLLSYSYSYV